MIKRLYAWAFVCLALAVTAQDFTNLHVRRADNNVIQTMTKRIDPNGALYFRQGLNLSPQELVELYKIDLGMSPDDEMRLVRIQHDDRGAQYHRFQQYHRGIPVEGAQYVVKTKGGELIRLKGRAVEDLSIREDLTVHEDSAFEAALRHVAADRYAWETPQARSSKAAQGQPTMSPTGEKIITRHQGEAVLAYRFRIDSIQPAGSWHVYVAADTGEVLRKRSRLQNAQHAVGTVTTLHDGARNLTTQDRGFPHHDYILRDRTRGDIHAKDYTSVIFNDWWAAGNYKQNIANTWGASTASTAFWAVQEAYDYFQNAHGLNGPDGANERVRIYADAPWTAYSHDGVGSQIFAQSGITSFDAMVHEYTHGVIFHSSNLTYEGESGALNESFADIFAVVAEYFQLNPVTLNWEIGEDFTIGAIRSLADPTLYDDPDTYQGQFWESTNPVGGCTPLNDFCGVHTNSGVQNKWFHLLSEGGTHNGVTVQSLGIATARLIAYDNMAFELTPGATFQDARQGSIDAARDRYGFCSFQAQAVTQAWAAVGVGAEWVTPCVVPLTATLSGPNSLLEGTSGTWSVSAAGGVGPYSYQWTYNGSPIGTNSSTLNFTPLQTNGTLNIGVTVTDADGRTTSRTMSVLILCEGNDCLGG